MAIAIVAFVFLLVWITLSAPTSPWGSALHWKTSGYTTNTYYVAHLAGMLSLVLVATSFLIAFIRANRTDLIIALALLVVVSYFLASDGKKNLARYIGYAAGWAQQTCWVPDSQECRDVAAFKSNPAAHKHPDNYL